MAPTAFTGGGSVDGQPAETHVELILPLDLHSSITKTKKYRLARGLLDALEKPGTAI